MNLFKLVAWAALLAKSEATISTCLSLFSLLNLDALNTTVQNSTYFDVGERIIAGLTNTVPFCEVYSSVNYGPGDNLVYAVWLPDADYFAGRFLAVGNGGFAGSIDFQTMMQQLNSGHGFAVAAGDAGHSELFNGIDGFATPNMHIPFLHSDEQTSAWIHNAISLFTAAAQSTVNSYYTQQINHSYYYGCSTGGAQGFSLAQYHPDLYDGIYAGSPGNRYSHLGLSFLWNTQHTNTLDTYLDSAKLSMVYQAVLKECDALDGVQDSLIENPLKCNFSIESLACASDQILKGFNCLTPSQMDALKAIYAGPVRADNGQQIYPGFTIGAEQELSLQEGVLSNVFTVPILQNRVFNNLTYDANTFNWASDVDEVDVIAGAYIEALSPDLSAFQQRGGKMLSTQGWMDPLNAPMWPIEHLQQINDFNGGDQDFYKLFMVPGGGHCGAATNMNDVPAVYDVMPALIDWIEQGQAPSQVYSDSPPDGSSRTRKLCAWPETAQYTGGDVDDWTSYVCAQEQ